MGEMEAHVRPGPARRVPTVCVLLSALFQERISYFIFYSLHVVAVERSGYQGLYANQDIAA